MKFKLFERVLLVSPTIKFAWMKPGVIVEIFEQHSKAKDLYTIEIDFEGAARRFTVFENEMRPA